MDRNRKNKSDKTAERILAAAVETNPDLPPIMMREVASGGANLPRVVIEDIASILGILNRGYCFDSGHTVRHSGSRKKTENIYRNITFSDSHDDYGNDSFF